MSTRIDLARLAKLAETARGTGYGPVELPPATVTALVRLGQAAEAVVLEWCSDGFGGEDLDRLLADLREALAPFRGDA